jgi:hypothetical protein
VCACNLRLATPAEAAEGFAAEKDASRPAPTRAESGMASNRGVVNR